MEDDAHLNLDDRAWLAELLREVGSEGAYEIADLLGIDLDGAVE
ncbi:hypothetical protein ABZ631_23400 [Nocardiopsis alba]